MNPKHFLSLVLTVPLFGVIVGAAIDLNREVPLPAGPGTGSMTAAGSIRDTQPAHADVVPSAAESSDRRTGLSRRRPASQELRPPMGPERLLADARLRQTGATGGTSLADRAADTAPRVSLGAEYSTHGASPRGGDRPGVSQSSAASGSLATVAVSPPAPLKKLPLPLAFQDLDAAALGLSEAQTGMLDFLRASFVREIGGAEQNADDPRYAERWRKVQPLNDERLRLFFGSEFADRVALRAAQAEYVVSHPQ